MQSEAQVIYTIVGAGLCVGGWALFWVGSRLLGVALGVAFGFFFGELLGIVLKLEANAALLAQLTCSILGALGGLMAMRAASTFAFALAGFLFGALLGRLGSELYAQWHHETYAFTTQVAIAVAASGGVMAVLALLMQKYIMIVITSYVGATFLVPSVEVLANHEPWATPAVILASILWQVILLTRLITSRRAAEPA